MGPPNRPLRRELEKNFLTRSAPCSQIDRHFLQKFIFQAHGGKFSQPSVKFQAMKWIPFFGFAERREIWKASGMVKVVVVVCMECKIASQHFCPLLPPNGPPLVILDHWRFSLPLNGSPGCGGKMKKSAQCGFSSLQKCGQLSVVRRVVGDHCRPSYGHQQSNKLAEYEIQIYNHVEWLWLRIP